MSNDSPLAMADIAKTMEALPTIMGAVTRVQSVLTPAQHASVVAVAADALTVAAQSARALDQAGLIGHNDADNVADGTALASEGLAIFGEVETLVDKLRALVKHVI